MKTILFAIFGIVSLALNVYFVVSAGCLRKGEKRADRARLHDKLRDWDALTFQDKLKD